MKICILFVVVLAIATCTNARHMNVISSIKNTSDQTAVVKILLERINAAIAILQGGDSLDNILKTSDGVTDVMKSTSNVEKPESLNSANPLDGTMNM